MRAALVTVAAGAALVAPAQAWAHGRSPTVALDYRLKLAPAPAGVHVRILDGDRSLETRVDPGVSLLVRGLLHEPMVRIDARGVFVNATSPTAQSDKLVHGGTGWHRIGGGTTYAWHEHRLAPSGQRGVFAIPVDVNGRASVIAGTFARVPHPALWPWLGGAGFLGASVVVAARRRSLRPTLALMLGVSGGVAALAASIAFSLRDRPTGSGAWLPVSVAGAIAVALGAAIVRASGRRRGRAAGVAGAVGAAVTISSLPVFWHGVVISALPADIARLACGLALVAGIAAATLSLLPELDS